MVKFLHVFPDIYESHGKSERKGSAGWLESFILSVKKRTQMLLTPQKANMTGWKFPHFQWEIHRLIHGG